MKDFRWRKSSHSSRVNCIEVALAPAHAAVRDSKAPESDHLLVERTVWGAFLGRVKAGRFDSDLG
jgi:hypothetical protein